MRRGHVVGARAEEAMLGLRNLTKFYPPTGGAAPASVMVPALRGVSLDIARGEFFTLLGPSGCGKTTTLQCLAGLEHPTTGTIEIEGNVVFCSDRNALVPSNKRGLGMVFQSYAIWPHMTVFENVAFPLRHGPKRCSATQIRQRVMVALERVKLAEFHDRPAPYLSGGQQQRVALARALVGEPSVMLLDEPLSNLDAKLRDAMRVELRDLVKSLGMTTIYVTHDQVEALSMSDRIALMDKGEVVQVGTPDQMYLRPRTTFVAEFIGRSNILRGSVAELLGDGRRAFVDVAFGRISCDLPADTRVGDPVDVVVRPHAIEFAEPGGQGTFEGRVVSAGFLGEFIDIELESRDVRLRVFGNPFDRVTAGQNVSFRVPHERCVALAA